MRPKTYLLPGFNLMHGGNRSNIPLQCIVIAPSYPIAYRSEAWDYYTTFLKSQPSVTNDQ